MIPKEFNPSIFSDGYLTRSQLLKGISGLTPLLGDGRLLDFGCGSKPYKSLFSNKEYIGLDIVNPGHPHVNEQIDVIYDGSTIPFPNDYFDCVFSTEVFEHVFYLEKTLSEINRVLKMHGRVLLTCPFVISEHEVPTDFARYSSFGIKSLMERNGFRVAIQGKLGGSMYAIGQLIVAYFEMHITPHFRKIPVIGGLIEKAIFGFLNTLAIVLSTFVPEGKELYLTNILICEKINPAC